MSGRMMNDEWISVKERLPDNSDMVYVKLTDSDGKSLDRYINGSWLSENYHGSPHEVTAWKPFYR